MSRKKRGNNKNDAQGNNFQDRSEIQEYRKGFRAGSETGTNRNSGRRYRKKGGKGVEENTHFNTNDGSWYIPTDQLGKDVTMIPNYWPIGQAVHRGAFTQMAHDQWIKSPYRTPGIFAFHLFQTLGEPGNPMSALNMSANMLYNKIRSENSRAATYNANDLMLIIYGMSQPHLFLKWCQRVYGVCRNVNILDRFTPRALVEAMRFDYDDLITNLGDFRLWINHFAVTLSQFPLPRGLNFFERCAFLYDNVYKDSESPKAQYYLNVPSGFYHYEVPLDVATGATLQFRPLTQEKYKFADLKIIGDNLLKVIYASEDFQNMSADLIKAFGSDLYQPVQIAEDYTVTPTYSTEVASQFENAVVLPIKLDTMTAEIYKHTQIGASCIKQNVKFGLSPLEAGLKFGNGGPDHHDILDLFNDENIILNFHGNKTPTPEEIMVATRLSQPSIEFYSFGNFKPEGPFTIKNSGTEVVVDMSITTISADGHIGRASANSFAYHLVKMDTSGDNPTITLSFAQLSNFGYLERIQCQLATLDWAPQVRYGWIEVESDKTLKSCSVNGINFELDNFTVISKRQLEDMNDIAKMGLFYPKSVPGVQTGI